MYDREKFDDNIYGFHAQQAAEKGLKAWLAFLGRSYPFRHDLGELLAALDDAGVDVENLWPLADFTPFAAVALRRCGNRHFTGAGAGRSGDCRAYPAGRTGYATNMNAHLSLQLQ